MEREPSSDSDTEQHVAESGSEPNLQEANNANEVLQMQEENDEDWESENEGMEEEAEEFSDDDEDEEFVEFGMEEEEEDSNNENEEQVNFNIPSLQIKLLPKQVLNIYKNVSDLKSFETYLTIPPGKKIVKEVCAKIVKHKDIIVECFDCRKDPSCIICIDCFKGGNHEGHRYVVKNAGGGCCDCGDVEAWSEEGFCEKHSGKFKDFEVDEKDFAIFKEKMQGLFYLYFWLTLKKQASAFSYFGYLLKYLKALNTDNLYYNKLLALVLCQPLPESYVLDNQLNKKTILENLLTFHITQTHFKSWFELFISMFSYYPFKLSILSHYMRNYGLIVDGTPNSASEANSISCQLLTSFKLVEQYALENKIGIGHDMCLPKVSNKLFNYYLTLMSDICSLTKLSDNASLVYFRMHINHEIGINNTLMYHDFLIKRIKKFYSNRSEAELVAQFIKFPIIERQTVWNFVDIIKNVKVEQELLLKIIKSLWNKCEKMNNKDQETLCILRPYERCLSIALFAYFDCSLQTIPSRRETLVNSVLSTTVSKFEETCSSILSRQFYTLFFYSKTQTFPGLGQTSYNYLYYYTINNKILANADLLSIKVFILLLGKSQVFEFEKIVGIDTEKLNDKNERKEKMSYLMNVLKIFRYLFLHEIPEIFIANGVNPESTAFMPQINNLFISLFKEHKNSISSQNLKTQLLDLIEFPETKSSKNWLTEHCTINKQNKMYSLRSVYEEQMLTSFGINYDDLWLGEASSDPFGDIKKSLKFVGETNGKIFRSIWNEANITCLECLLKAFMSTSENYEELKQILNFYTLLYSINKANKLGCKFDEKILVNSMGVIPNNVLVELELAVENVKGNENENEKKEKAQEIRARKLLEMKKKRSDFLKKEDQEGSIFIEKVEESEGHMENCCCICKNELNENSVLLVSLSVRNHEKLLNLGPGLECLSLNTCRHIFDYECILKKWKSKRIIDNVRCPLCKFESNLLMPASLKYDNTISVVTATRVMELLDFINKGVNVYEEVVKSFYQYFLLCMVDLEKSVEKKGLLYQILLDVTCKNIKENEFKKIESNFREKKFVFHYKTYLKENEDSLYDEATLQNLRLLINGQEINENIRNEIRQVLNMRADLGEAPGKEKLSEKSEESVSKIFKTVIDHILEHIKENGEHLQNLNNEEKESRMEEEQNENSFMSLFMRTLTDPKFELSDVKEIPSPGLEKEKLQILQPLPFKYSELSSKKCSECSEITIDLIRCLLCNWQGCQGCENSRAITHINRVHGEIGAVMKVQKATAFYISGEREVYAGKLYESAWESRLERSGDWENFELNSSILSEIEKRVLLDDIPTRNLQGQN